MCASCEDWSYGTSTYIKFQLQESIYTIVFHVFPFPSVIYLRGLYMYSSVNQIVSCKTLGRNQKILVAYFLNSELLRPLVVLSFCSILCFGMIRAKLMDLSIYTTHAFLLSYEDRKSMNLGTFLFISAMQTE